MPVIMCKLGLSDFGSDCCATAAAHFNNTLPLKIWNPVIAKLFTAQLNANLSILIFMP